MATFDTERPATHMVMAANRLVFFMDLEGVHALRHGQIRAISPDGCGCAEGNAAWPQICSPFLATTYSDALRLFHVRREIMVAEFQHRPWEILEPRDLAVSWMCGQPVLCADWVSGPTWRPTIKTLL